MFTDQARMRLEDLAMKIIDWLLETIDFCRMDNNVNWFLKLIHTRTYTR